MFGKVTQEKLMAWGAKGKLAKLRPYLENSDVNIRVAAARAMGQIDTEEAANMLILVLRDPSVEVQKAVVESLGKMSYQAAEEHVRQLYRATTDKELQELCLKSAHHLEEAE